MKKVPTEISEFACVQVKGETSKYGRLFNQIRKYAHHSTPVI